MVGLWRGIGRELAEALFPRRCYLCGAAARNGLACAAHGLPGAPPGPRCGTCAGALPSMIPDGALCAACRLRSPGFRAVVALADYRAQPGCRPWLFALKYGGRRDLARPLGLVMGETWRERAPAGLREGALLVPVPLHWRRALERGHDQARSLAVHASAAAGVPWASLLARWRATAVQGAAVAASRSANVRDAFRLVRRPALSPAGRVVWLVDDVVTSGATAAECARVLRRAGATAVGVLCIARASPRTAGTSVEPTGVERGRGPQAVDSR